MTSRFKNKTFLLRVGTVLVGVVNLGLVADSYYPVFTERPFLGAVSIFFIISLLTIIATVMDWLPETPSSKRLDIFYHVVAFLALFMTGSVFLFSVMGYPIICPSGNCKTNHLERYGAAFLGIANAFLYAFVGWTMLEVKIVSRSRTNLNDGDVRT